MGLKTAAAWAWVSSFMSQQTQLASGRRLGAELQLVLMTEADGQGVWPLCGSPMLMAAVVQGRTPLTAPDTSWMVWWTWPTAGGSPVCDHFGCPLLSLQNSLSSPVMPASVSQ